jgi:hypothetical protein
MVWGWNSGRGKRFFLLPNRPDLLWDPPRYWNFFPRIERPKLEVDYSHPHSTDIRKKWSCTPTSPICVRGVNGNLHFAFHSTLIWRYKEVLLLLAAAWTWLIFPSSLSLPPNQTKTHALLRLSAERKDVLMALRQTGCVSGNYIIVRLLHYIISHQLPNPVHNTNSTTQCIGVVCVRTEVWRAV